MCGPSSRTLSGVSRKQRIELLIEWVAENWSTVLGVVALAALVALAWIVANDPTVQAQMGRR